MWLGLDIGGTKCAVLAGKLTSSGMVVCEKRFLPRQRLPIRGKCCRCSFGPEKKFVQIRRPSGFPAAVRWMPNGE